MKVKICGIKSIEDAMKSIEYGADAIGLLVGQEHLSNDFITVEKARKIVLGLPPFVSTVLVTHITSPNEIIKMINNTCVNTVQLHSNIEIEDINKIKKSCPYVKIIKLVHIIDENSEGIVEKFSKYVDAILLDTVNFKTDQVGGTGIIHDWEIDKKIVEKTNAKIIVAGGLNKDNVEDAIIKIKPYGVDVNSGVQNENGFKDYTKLKLFIENAKHTKLLLS